MIDQITEKLRAIHHSEFIRNTSQTLFDLQNEIKAPSSAKSCLYSVFFDLQEAFPRVWRHYIVQKLFKLGVRGNLLSLLQSFLNNGFFMVRIQNVTFSPLTVENDIPQGGVFSVPHFLIAINVYSFHSTNVFLLTIQYISLRSSNPARAHTLLQEVLDIITVWSNNKGFRFSSKKNLHGYLQKKESHSLP